jgi:DNA topoisomerase-2
MHLFNENGAIEKYSSVGQIIKQFFKLRMEFYKKRKAYNIGILEHDIIMMNAKASYIVSILQDKINMKIMDEEKLNEYLTKEKYPKDNNSFNYLLNLATRTLTKDNVEKLKNQINEKQKELDELKNKTAEQLYMHDLEALEKIL